MIDDFQSVRAVSIILSNAVMLFRRCFIFIIVFWCGFLQAHPAFYTLTLTGASDVFGLAKVSGKYNVIIYIKGGINLPALPCRQGDVSAAEALCRCVFHLSCWVDKHYSEGNSQARLQISPVRFSEETVCYDVSASILWRGAYDRKEVECIHFQRRERHPGGGLFLFNAPLIITTLAMLKIEGDKQYDAISGDNQKDDVKASDDRPLIYFRSISMRASSPYQQLLSFWEPDIKDTPSDSIIRLTGNEADGVFVTNDLIMHLNRDEKKDFTVYTTVTDEVKSIGVKFNVIDECEYKRFYQQLIAPKKIRRSKSMDKESCKKKNACACPAFG